MLLRKIESEGLAHYSYIVGDGTDALVIDPRRDCGIYERLAREAGMSVRYVLETHRNEDFVTGSLGLAAMTGAEVWHADTHLDYSYGTPAKDGQKWRAGSLEIRALLTPGHTPGSMSYLLSDPEGRPWICFTGDALLAGGAGRTDLMGGERSEEMSGILYDSIFGRLLPLGDEVMVCPAHGQGSVCGSGMSSRPWTTMGFERKYSPALRVSGRDDFVEKASVVLERPPYFTRMEQINLRGDPVHGMPPVPKALTAKEFDGLRERSFLLDTRDYPCFSSACVPGSLSIWKDGLASMAGWFVPYGKPVLLVSEGDPLEETLTLFRMGYDTGPGYLSGGMLSWYTAGRDTRQTDTMTVQELCRRLDDGEEPFILDVRSEAELESVGRIPGALHIHVTRLPEEYSEVPDDRPVAVFCGTGSRSMVAASFLEKKGYRNLSVVLGGLAGWKSSACGIQPGAVH